MRHLPRHSRATRVLYPRNSSKVFHSRSPGAEEKKGERDEEEAEGYIGKKRGKERDAASSNLARGYKGRASQRRRWRRTVECCKSSGKSAPPVGSFTFDVEFIMPRRTCARACVYV